MTPFLRGFSDELVKLGADDSYTDVYREAKKDAKSQPSRDSALRGLRGGGTPVSRDYLASMVIGAASAPLIGALGKRIARSMNNKEVHRAMRGVLDPRRRKELAKELHTGKTFGRAMPGAPLGKRPLMTHGETAGAAAAGGAGGGALQMVRDYFAGSSPAKRKDES